MVITEIFIYGASGHGKVIADIAQRCGHTIAGWIDDSSDTDTYSWEDFCLAYPNGSIAIGIGDNNARERITHKVTEAGYQLPSLIHPSAVISGSATIGEGSVVMPLAVINADAAIGKGCIINSGAIVEHDCIVENYVHISPNAALSGGVHVKQNTHIGIGTNIIQNIRIGAYCITAAGSAVVHHVADYSLVAGVPATVKKNLPKDIHYDSSAQ